MSPRSFSAFVLFSSALWGQLATQEQLLRPRALAREPGPAALEEFRREFAAPAADYRSMPLWVWNDQLEWPRLQEMLAQYKQAGMGGAFVHPRPGLMTEYLGADWWKLWKQSAEEGRRLGIQVNIYDENSYPSGFAGGHVPALAPDTASQYVQAEVEPNPASIAARRANTVGFFAVERDAAGNVTSARRVFEQSQVPAGREVLAFRLRRASGNPWTGEFPYVDLTNPRTAPVFLETTYEPYKREVGRLFGSTVKYAFSDEPLLATGGAYDAARLALPLSYNTLAEFRRRNGYDLADHLPSLYWDTGEFRRVRFDYWQTLHDLWKENFMGPMFQWCDRNNLQFTGHWMEHEWPAPWITPADASLYAYQHVPGIDMLEGTALRLTGQDPHLLFTIRQVASVSHQLGRRAFCEAYGVAGWDSTFEHYKRFGDWLLVHGVNFINQHLSFATIRGARKRDHPQSFSDVSAWWPYYRLHGDHLARWSYASSRSEARHRLLVLQQTTSGFLLARRGGAAPELAQMRRENGALNQFLADHQVDYDLGDEYMIEWFGKLEGKRFAIGKARYELVVLPPGLTNLRRQTLPLVERYLAAGGEIVALAPPPAFIDGRENAAAVELQKKYAAQWRQVGSLGEMLAAVEQRLPPRVEFEGGNPAQVGFAERWLAGGARVLFFSNSGLKPVSVRAVVAGSSAEVLDTVSGAMTAAAYRPVPPGRVSFPVELAPAGSLLVLVREDVGTPGTPAAQTFTAAQAGGWRISTDQKNVLALDYCDYTVGGETVEDANTWRANWDIWQRHGFERPAWDNAVQYRRSVFDRNRFAAGSGFEAVFRFEADAAALPGLELAVEMPELYQISLNGRALDFRAARRWLDPRLLSLPVEARAGANEVRIAGQPFDVKMELENIYLRGAFAVAPAARGFTLKPAAALGFGAWARQGLPFYGDAVTYETDVRVAAGQSRLQVSLAEWHGSVAEVLLDGKRVALLGWQPWSAEFAAAPGEHKLAVRVVATPRNVLGPFHNSTKPRMRAWPAAWADFPATQPPGSAYDVIEYGLMTPPLVAAR
jgi:hypothetical protein